MNKKEIIQKIFKHLHNIATPNDTRIINAIGKVIADLDETQEARIENLIAYISKKLPLDSLGEEITPENSESDKFEVFRLSLFNKGFKRSQIDSITKSLREVGYELLIDK